MASDGIRAGSLFWDLDITDQEKVLRKADELGRKLDEALNKRRTPPGGGGGPLDGVAEEADRAKNRLSEFQAEFTRLTAQFRTGQTTASQYGSSLSNLQSRIRQTAQATDLTNQEYATLNSLLPRVERAQATLGGTTAEVQAKTQALASEIRRLRNDWQRTGEATDQTKARLAALAQETAEYAAELKQADGGTVRFNRQLDQLAVAGRSAQATIDGMEGRISRLGLASQVNLGVLNALQNQLNGLGPAGRIAGQGIGIVAGGFNTMGTGAMLASGGVLAVGAAAGALAARGIPEVKEMQSALRVLVASGENLSQAQLDQTLRRIQESAGAAGTQFRRAEIATALAEIVKAGVDMADAMHLLEPGMHLANVTGQELNETTLLLLGNLRQFGLDTTEAARVADALAEADLAAAEGARELSEGLAIVGPVAAAAGLEFEDVLGILVELDNKGMSAANVGATALRGAFSALLDPTEKARGVLAELGVELTDGTGKRRPLLDVLHDLRDALEGNEEAAAIAAQVFDTRAITAVVNMTEKSEEFAEALRNSGGALRAYSDTMTEDNLQKAQESFSNAVADLALTFSGTFANDIARATTALAGWIRTVDSWLGRFDEDRLVTQYEADYGVTFAPNARERVRAVLNELSRLDEEARQLQEAIDARANVPGWAGAGLEQMQRRLDANREAAAALRQELIDMQREAAMSAQAAAPEDPVERAVAAARTATTETTALGEKARTVNDIFAELAEKGAQVERAAVAMGGTLEADLWSLEQRSKLVDAALQELLARPDVGEHHDRVSYLIDRSEELETNIARVKRQLATLGSGTSAILGLPDGDTTIGGVTIPGGPLSPFEDEARRRTVEQRIKDAEQLEERRAAARARVNQRYVDELNQLEQAQLDQSLARDAEAERKRTAREEAVAAARERVNQNYLNELMGLEGAYYSWHEEQEAARVAKEEAAAAERLATQTRFFDELVALETAQGDWQVQQNIARAQREERERQAREQARAEARERVNQRYVNELLELEAAQLAYNEAQDAAGVSIETLQRRLINLRALGYEPTSAAIQETVRQINELQLRAALEELREKGFENLSEFAKKVLEMNGVLATGEAGVNRFTAALRGLNDASASGLADIIDGIELMTQAAGDAETVIEGLTLALEGATALVEALGEGDAFEMVKAAAMVAGEAIGQAMGVPGVGGAVGAVFDLGRAIVQAISDAFTGDSPAARAIREGLTPAVQSAFANGILLALQSGEDWHEALRENLKLAFLTSLINAFVQSAIIGPILQPIFTEYSKMVSRGQWEAAGEFLASTLPGAIERGITAAEQFMSHLPPSLLPTRPPDPNTGSGSGGDAFGGPTGVFELPTAAVTGIAAPEWARDLVNAGRLQLEAAQNFAQAVELLRSEGITIRTEPAAQTASGGAAPATARAV